MLTTALWPLVAINHRWSAIAFCVLWPCTAWSGMTGRGCDSCVYNCSHDRTWVYILSVFTLTRKSIIFGKVCYQCGNSSKLMLKCSSTGEMDKTIESGKSWQSIREAFCAAHVSTGVTTSPEAELDCSMPGRSSHEDHLGISRGDLPHSLAFGKKGWKPK